MDVKILASQPFLSRLIDRLHNPKSSVNPERYKGFEDVFGKGNYGFVLAGDLQKELEIGKRAPVYFLDKNLCPFDSGERGIACKLFIPSAFSIGFNGYPSRTEVEELIGYLDMHQVKGNIGKMVNSKKGTLSEDKMSILELQAQGIQTPSTYYFSEFAELRDFLDVNSREYVLKHRFGAEGEQLFLVNRDNVGSFASLDVENYVFQEKVDILDEKRLIFFQDELLGARRIFDRHMPWEEEGKAGRKHITQKYSPSEEEIEESREILQDFDVTVGCIDWINVRGKRYYLEYNGIGTGYGKGSHPYNLNQEVAERLKETFL